MLAEIRFIVPLYGQIMPVRGIVGLLIHRPIATRVKLPAP